MSSDKSRSVGFDPDDDGDDEIDSEVGSVEPAGADDVERLKDMLLWLRQHKFPSVVVQVGEASVQLVHVELPPARSESREASAGPALSVEEQYAEDFGLPMPKAPGVVEDDD